MFRNIELSGAGVGIAFLLLALVTVGIIYFFRNKFKNEVTRKPI
jgi:hypothetical protein